MPLPSSVLEAIALEEGLWTDHAADGRDRLGIEWADVLAVARTAASVKKVRDERRPGTYKYAVVGRDTRGRKLYMAGKLVRYGDQRLWRILTIHEAD